MSQVNLQGASQVVTKESLLTKDFIFIVIALAFVQASYQLTNATIALYVNALGSAASITGTIGLAWTITSLVLRPIAGKMSDRYGIRQIAFAGGVIYALGCVGAAAMPDITALFIFRIIQAVGHSTLFTAANTGAALLLPTGRSGEGAAYSYGIPQSLSLAFGSNLGLALIIGNDFSWVFYATALASVLAVCSVLVVRRFIKSQAKENIGMTTEQSQAEAGEYKGFWKIAEKTALMPSSIVLLIGASSTALMMFIPLYAKTAGIPGVGQFYTAVAVCVFVMCLWVGRIVDKFGSLPVLIPAFLLYALSFGYLLFGGTNFLIAGVLWGVGASCTTSPIFAMVVKRAPKVRMGLATGTFLFANSLGLGLGGFIWGFVIQHAGFQWMFEGSVIATVVVIIYTYVACKKMKV